MRQDQDGKGEKPVMNWRPAAEADSLPDSYSLDKSMKSSWA